MQEHIELHRQAVLSHPASQPFWEAAAKGVLLLPKCLNCGEFHWYPRPFCPFCHSEAQSMVAASGNGVIYACAALERLSPANIVAYVALEEGPIMLTNLVGCDPGAPRIGDAVRVAFSPLESGYHLPVFRLRG